LAFAHPAQIEEPGKKLVKRLDYVVIYTAKTCAYIKAPGTSQVPYYCYGDYCGFSSTYAGCVNSGEIPTTCADYTSGASPCGGDFLDCPGTAFCTSSESEFCNTYIYSGTYTAFGCGTTKVATPLTINGGAFDEYGPTSAFTGIYGATSILPPPTETPTLSVDAVSPLDEAAAKIHVSKAGLIGIIVGGAIFLLLLCCGACFCCSRIRKRRTAAVPPSPLVYSK